MRRCSCSHSKSRLRLPSTVERRVGDYHMAIPRPRSRIASPVATTPPQHDCLGQLRARAPASAAFRFELVVHVQAPGVICELARSRALMLESSSSGTSQQSMEVVNGSMRHAHADSRCWCGDWDVFFCPAHACLPLFAACVGLID
jgi:hypothetical protein